jgi:hypothetical protein
MASLTTPRKPAGVIGVAVFVEPGVYLAEQHWMG